jgi:hypothetical protein
MRNQKETDHHYQNQVDEEIKEEKQEKQENHENKEDQ